MGKNYIGEIRYIDKEPEFFPKESGKKTGTRDGCNRLSLSTRICEHLENNIVILVLLIAVLVNRPYKT